MPATRQQRETLSYFNSFADDWLRKSGVDSPAQVNVIRQRNGYVLDWLSAHPQARALLDVGCGTGDLALEAARRGAQTVGIDFAEEMIRIAEERAEKEGLSSARFVCASVFDFEFEPSAFDAISANGFIEYISLEQLRQFLAKSFRGLKRGGALLLGSRNRLFNAFSLNKFTEDELASGTVEPLLWESIAWTRARSFKDLRGLAPAPLPKKAAKQANTGIGVSVRHQFTPLQLARLLEGQGFSPCDVAPIHIHGVPPKFKDAYPEIHARMSNLLHSYSKSRLELLPWASSFMIAARKGK